MEIFNAISYEKNEIKLDNNKQLEELYNMIDTEANFILTWTENNKDRSEIIISSNIKAKVKTGDIVLSSTGGY